MCSKKPLQLITCLFVHYTLASRGNATVDGYFLLYYIFKTFSYAATLNNLAKLPTYSPPPHRMKDRVSWLHYQAAIAIKLPLHWIMIRHCWNHLKPHHTAPSLQRESVPSLSRLDATGCSCQFHAKLFLKLKRKTIKKWIIKYVLKL